MCSWRIFRIKRSGMKFIFDFQLSVLQKTKIWQFTLLASYLKPKEYFNILDEPWLNNKHASYPSFFVLALFCTLQTYYSASRGCFIMWAFQFTQGHGMPGLKSPFSVYVMIMYNVYIHVCSLCTYIRYMYHYAGMECQSQISLFKPLCLRLAAKSRC